MLTLTVRTRRRGGPRWRERSVLLTRGEAAAWTALVAAVGVAGSMAWGALGAAVALALAPVAVAAVVDRRTGRVPDLLLVAAAAVTVATAAALGPPALEAIAIGTAAMAVPVLVLHLALPDAMGFGDVKLAAVLGSVVGFVDWRLACAVLALASAAALVVAFVHRRASVAFAPALVGATAIVMFASAPLGWEALGWR